MPKKKRLKAPPAPAKGSTVNPKETSPRFQFFLWICSFFFFAALVIRLDVITPWPGAESYSLDHALSNYRGDSPLSFLYNQLFAWGAAIDESTEAIWLFPRLLSAGALIATGVATYVFGGRLFGRTGVSLGLLAAGASLFLPFFGKVATPDALALFGQAGFLYCVYLIGADREKNYLLAAGGFLFVAGLAAPLSSLVFGAGAILTGRLLLGGNKQWVSALMLLSLPLVILLLQGTQGSRSYWFWGSQPFAYLQFLLYSLLGFLPVAGFLLAGIRDLIFNIRRGEQAGRLYAGGVAVAFLTQSLVFPLLLASLAGKQMHHYFRSANYPWRDWVRGGAIVHVVLAFIGAFATLLLSGISFSTAGFRAALGMGAAYWIFSLLGVIGLYGDKRDFALGGVLLSGLLGALFFWVQVYPYLEAERNWARRLADKMELKLPVYVPPSDAHSVALPAFRRAGIPVVEDSTAADFRLVSWPPTDTLSTADIELPGRIVIEPRIFGLDH